MWKDEKALFGMRREGFGYVRKIRQHEYLGISEMPVVSSSYWNMVHGNTPQEVKEDLEGMQTMRNIGKNLAWLLKCIEAGKQSGIEAPVTEHGAHTNFIR